MSEDSGIDPIVSLAIVLPLLEIMEKMRVGQDVLVGCHFFAGSNFSEDDRAEILIQRCPDSPIWRMHPLANDASFDSSDLIEFATGVVEIISIDRIECIVEFTDSRWLRPADLQDPTRFRSVCSVRAYKEYESGQAWLVENSEQWTEEAIKASDALWEAHRKVRT